MFIISQLTYLSMFFYPLQYITLTDNNKEGYLFLYFEFEVVRLITFIKIIQGD